jgi:hypothetical protein
MSGLPLAYFFWHWHRDAVDRVAYENALRRFHADMAAARIAGFVGSSSASISAVPWAAAGGRAYQERYTIENSATLDRMEAWISSDGTREAHEAVAALTGGATAGLYQGRLGDIPETSRVAYWFGKPAGMRYAELFHSIEIALRGRRGMLWMRRLALGPAELCVEADEELVLPPTLQPLAVALHGVCRMNAQ